MAVLNYEGLSYLYNQLIAHFANQNDVKLLSDEVGQLEANLEKTFNTVKVGETSITGSSTTPLTLKGDNIILTPNADNKTITFSISDKTIQGALEDFNFGIASESKEGLIKSGGDISVDANGIVSVKDNSHNHTIENVSGLSTKFTEITQYFDNVESDIEIINTTLTEKQNEAQVQNLIDSAINQLKDGAPDALNTLNELAAALGDDKDYYQTIDKLINGIEDTLKTKANVDDLDAHIANKENPHEVTVVEEGEGNIVSSFENGAQIVAHKDAYGFSKKEGNIVQEKCLEEMPIRVKTVLEPVQEGSGDPYPAGGGKNLLPLRPGQTASSNGNTATVQTDGSILVTGTAGTSSTFIYLCSFNLSAGSYVLSFEADTKFPTAGEAIRITNGDAMIASLSLDSSRNNYVFNLAESGSVNFVIRVSAGTTVNHTVRVQLEAGTAKTDWMAPSNIRPISGWADAKLTRCGKNLLPKLSAQNGESNGVKYVIAEDGTITASGTAEAHVVLPIVGTYSPVQNIMPGLTAGTYYARDVSVRITNPLTGTERFMTNLFALN